MKKYLFACFTAGALVWTPGLIAQTTNTTGGDTTEQHQQMRQNRQELLRILGLSREELKDLSPEDRRTKIKDATKAKLSELKAKKDDGTITPEEQKDLDFLKSHAGHKGKRSAESATTPPAATDSK